jgi:mono/diheme cytochrome c family protein
MSWLVTAGPAEVDAGRAVVGGSASGASRYAAGGETCHGADGAFA